MIRAYLVMSTSNGERTVYSRTFFVESRPKPAGYVYTETETLNYSSLDKRLKKLEGDGLTAALNDYFKENPIEVPYIGENGNWWIGEEDTGEPSQGEFIVVEDDIKEIAQQAAAMVGGNKLAIQDTAPEDTSVLWVDPSDDTEDGFDDAVNTALEKAKSSGKFDGKSAYEYARDGGYVGTEAEFAAKLAEEIPSTIPNPNSLTIGGVTYDGSATVDMTEKINALIDTKLGVIENGTY